MNTVYTFDDLVKYIETRRADPNGYQGGEDETDTPEREARRYVDANNGDVNAAMFDAMQFYAS